MGKKRRLIHLLTFKSTWKWTIKQISQVEKTRPCIYFHCLLGVKVSVSVLGIGKYRNECTRTRIGFQKKWYRASLEPTGGPFYDSGTVL